MSEELLFAYLREHGPFAEWVVQYPQLADRVVIALITLNNLNGSSELFDLLACRDAAQEMHMIAREGKFDEVALVFSMQYDQFARAVLPFLGEVA
jgi:1,2-phenylacetyl-CoA epoxidase catalytic subunit